MNKNFRDKNIDEKINERISQFRVPYLQTKEEAFDQLKAKISSGTYVESAIPSGNHRIRVWMTSAAAVVLIFAGMWAWLFYKPVKNVITPRGQHTEYQLPDGSLVSLNAESSISFIRKNFTNDRTLSMKGEAFFSVKKGSAFTIHTQYADVRILGTSLNIQSRNNSFKVSCVTGKVQVSDNRTSLVITPGESVVLKDNILTRYTDPNMNAVTGWKNGEFSYENTPLNIIFNEMERQFNVTFVTTLLPDKMFFTGSFSNKNLNDALDIVCIPMGLTYEVGRNDNIFIKEKDQ